MGETLHVAYKNIKEKENLLFWGGGGGGGVNTKHISSRELKTSEFSLVLRTRENSDVFNTSDIHFKKVKILDITSP